MKRQNRPSVLTAAAAVLLLLFILVLWVRSMCFDRAFYAREYAGLKTAQSIGMSPEALDRATETLLDYLEQKRDDLCITEEINGEQREVFNDREKAHMVDVRSLYQSAITVSRVCLAAAAALVLALFIWKKKRALLPALRGYVAGNCVFLAIVAALGIWAAADFYNFWTSFHHVFFTNDLWLLDPNTDILIMMVPGQFFFDLVMRIVAGFAVTAGVLLAACLIAIKKLKKRSA